MKKGFLKCFALTLVLISSLQFGSFAAKKNISNYSYTPKTQLVGLKNKFYGTYKKNDKYLATSDYFVNEFFRFMSDRLHQLGINFSFNGKSINTTLKVNKNGNGNVSFSSKYRYTISGMSISNSSNVNLKFIHKGDNIFVYDFSDILNILKVIFANNESIDIEELTKSFEDSLTFSLSKEVLTKEHINEIENSLQGFSSLIPEFEVNDTDFGLEIGKEYLIQRSIDLGIITAIYEIK